MPADLKRQICEIIARGQDMVVATVRFDGAPQTTTVSYASDGMTLYFGTSAGSQKARNLARDDRVSIAINHPYKDWSQIRGLSLFGHARRLTAPDKVARVSALFIGKFPDLPQYVMPDGEELCLFEVEPEVISVLDYRQGFGHTELAYIRRLPSGEVETA